MHLVLENSDGSLRDLDLKTKVLEPDFRALLDQKKVVPLKEIQYYEQGNSLIVCKIPTFVLREKDIDQMTVKMNKEQGRLEDLQA